MFDGFPYRVMLTHPEVLAIRGLEVEGQPSRLYPFGIELLVQGCSTPECLLQVVYRSVMFMECVLCGGR